MMQRERDNRYSTPAELIHDLELIADGKMPEIAAAGPGTVMWGSKDVKEGEPAPAAAPARAPAQKKLPPLAWAAVAGGGVVALLLVVLIVALLSGPPDETPDGGRPPDTGGVTTDVGALVKKTLEEIDALAKAGQFEQAIQACEDAKSSYDGTPHAQVFATRLGALKLDQARAERETAAKERLDAIVADREAGELERALGRAREAKDKYARTSLADDFRKQVTELEAVVRAARLAKNRLVKIETLEEAGALDRALELAKQAETEFEASGQAGPLVEAATRLGAKIAKRDAAKLAGAAEKERRAVEALDRAQAAAGKYAATPSGEAIAGLVESLKKRVAERGRKRDAAARAKALLARAEASMRQGRFADAAAAYSEAGKILPSDEASKGAAEARFRMHMQLSAEKERAGDVGAAIEETKKALAVKPDASASKRLSTLQRRLKVVGMVAEAQRLEAGGKIPGALGAYRQALGAALSDQKPAIEAAIKRIGLSSEYAEAMRSARSHGSAKRWKEARSAVERALKSKPGDAAALVLRDTIRQAAAATVKVARVTPLKVPEKRPIEAPRETRETAESAGITFVLVDAGEYAIGDERGQPDERPVRKVKLDAYYIGVTEVTNAQYEKFDSRHKRSEFSPGDDHPVVNVSWSDAEKFCKWLSKKEKARCRLPTEAEWEAAARGKEGRRFPWGSEAPDSGGVFRANWGEGDDRAGWARDGFRNAAPVGKFPAGASPFGCLDMAGNVWEWCGDRYSDDYYARGDLENPKGARRGSDRVLRGGAFNNDIEYARSANRHKTSYKRDDPTIGFRVVMETK
ncbi:MAG: formylglycine-generating enzyme family protein, partial [Planctomycetota bacterium]